MAELTIEPSGATFFVAGQAVGACLEGLEIERLGQFAEDDEVWIDVIEPELPAGPIRDHSDCAAAKSLIRALLAGPAAQQRYSFGAASGRNPLGSDAVANEDCVWRAIDLAGRLKSEGAVMEPLWGDVCALIARADVWTAIMRVAASLSTSDELLGCEVEEIVRFSIPNFER
jgi:hypothetical protein